MAETVEQMRNRMRGEKLVKALEQRNIEAWYVTSKEAALKKALELIPEGSSVGWGGSVSVGAIGLQAAIREGNYVAIDRETASTPEEKNRITHGCLSADWFLTSTNAISEDGIMVNIDGNANRVAALCYGPAHVLYIVGMNKVVRSAEDAYRRAKFEAAPINAQRFPIETPCRKTGCCYDCKTPDTICCQILITRYSKVPGRAKVILVDDNLGF